MALSHLNIKKTTEDLPQIVSFEQLNSAPRARTLQLRLVEIFYYAKLPTALK